MKRKSIIISISSYNLSLSEEDLIQKGKPWGVILFKRNIKSFDQLKNLTSRIRFLMKDPFYPILVDQEGGKVNRLSNLIDMSEFSQSYFGKLYEKNKLFGINSYKKYLTFTFQILKESGININTIPVLDILRDTTHSIIGNRSYSRKSNIINALKKVCLSTSNDLKIGTVSKHIPGHGCSNVDTHKNQSIVNKSEKYLFRQDFKAFNQIKSNFAMTAHIIYKKIDSEFTATHSKKIIKNIIRNKLGFKGILISDDISMKALNGNLVFNANKAIESGCNLALYCGGKVKESRELLSKIVDIDNFTKKKTSEFYRFLR